MLIASDFFYSEVVTVRRESPSGTAMGGDAPTETDVDLPAAVLPSRTREPYQLRDPERNESVTWLDVLLQTDPRVKQQDGIRWKVDPADSTTWVELEVHGPARRVGDEFWVECQLKV